MAYKDAQRVLEFTLQDLEKLGEIPIGYAGENAATTIRIDLGEWLGNAVVDSLQLLVKNAAGDVYPGVTQQLDRSLLEWDVSAADLSVPGLGEIQVVLNARSLFTQDIICKTSVVKTRVFPSLSQNSDTPPDGFETWMTQLLQASSRIHTVIARAETLPEGSDATAHFDPDTGYLTIGVPRGREGYAGVSPTVSVEAIDNGHRVTIADAEKTISFNVMDGDVSPQYELIETIIVSEAAAISRQAEPDGTPYNFKHMLVIFRANPEVPSSGGFNARVHFNGNNKYVQAWIGALTAGTSQQIASASFERSGGVIQVISRYYGKADTVYTAQINMLSQVDGNIDRFDALAEMPVGLSIEIWGVRA